MIILTGKKKCAKPVPTASRSETEITFATWLLISVMKALLSKSMNRLTATFGVKVTNIKNRKDGATDGDSSIGITKVDL